MSVTFIFKGADYEIQIKRIFVLGVPWYVRVLPMYLVHTRKIKAVFIYLTT